MGLDPETIRKYRAAVDPFAEHYGVTYVDECRDNKQVLLNYMGWWRKQPEPNEHVQFIAVFRLFVLLEQLRDADYGAADADETFLLDLFHRRHGERP